MPVGRTVSATEVGAGAPYPAPPAVCGVLALGLFLLLPQAGRFMTVINAVCCRPVCARVCKISEKAVDGLAEIFRKGAAVAGHGR